VGEPLPASRAAQGETDKEAVQEKGKGQSALVAMTAEITRSGKERD